VVLHVHALVAILLLAGLECWRARTFTVCLHGLALDLAVVECFEGDQHFQEELLDVNME